MRTVIVPPRAGVFSAVGLLVRARAAGAGASRGPTPRLAAGSTTRVAALGGAGRRARSARRRRRPAGSTAGTRARATSSWSPTSTSSPPPTRSATATPAPGSPSRWSRCGRAVAVRGAARRRRPARPDRRGRGRTRGRRRVRLHAVAPRRVGGRAPGAGAARWMRGAQREPGRAADPGLPPGVDRRRDGRGAAPRRVRAPTSRSGPTARRRCSPPTASCWPRPSTSRCTSARCRRRCAAAIDAPARVRHRDVMLNDPFAGGTHLNDLTMVAPVARRRHGWSAGSPTAPTTPTSAAPRRARCPPTRSTIHEEGLRLPPDPVRRRGAASWSWPRPRTPDERRGDLDAQRGANRLGVERLAELARLGDTALRRDPRLRRAAHAGRAAPSFPTAAGRPTTCSTPPARVPSSRRPRAITVAVHVDGDEITFDFTGTDAQRPAT